MTRATLTILAWASAAAGADPTVQPARFFERAEPHLVAGAGALQGGDPDTAIEKFRGARAQTSDELAIVEYDVALALAAQARVSATQPTSQNDSPVRTGPDDTGDVVAGPPTPLVFDDAVAACERARDLAVSPALRAEAAHAAANLLAESGKIDDAIRSWRRALREHPGHVRARHNLQRALEWKKRQPPPQQQQQSEGGDGEGEGEQQQDQAQGETDSEQHQEQRQRQQQNGQDKERERDEKKQDAAAKSDAESSQPGQKHKDDHKPGGQDEQDPGRAGKAQPPQAADGNDDAARPKSERLRRMLKSILARERALTPLDMRGEERRRARQGKDW